VKVLRSQGQTAGDGSTNLQAGRDIVYNGVTAAEAKQIALDVYASNFLKLVGVAEDVARDRAERITRDYLDKLQAENPSGLGSVQDPDMLQAIFTAQKAYACSGEDDLEKMLVDLLVDRSRQQDRELKTLVLNEAIATLPKLSVRQRKSIAVCFLIRHTRYVGSFGLEPYYDSLAQSFTPFADMLSGKRADCQHIQSVGAGSISAFTLELSAAFTDTACGCFTSGFTADQVPKEIQSYLNNSEIFMQCIRDPDKLQLCALSKQDVMNLPVAEDIKARGLLNSLSLQGIMSYQEIQSELESHVPCMKAIFEQWNSSDSALRYLDLTSLGIAIGHGYWRHATGNTTSLETWL
jgi:hypothetical protein